MCVEFTVDLLFELTSLLVEEGKVTEAFAQKAYDSLSSAQPEGIWLVERMLEFLVENIEPR